MGVSCIDVSILVAVTITSSSAWPATVIDALATAALSATFANVLTIVVDSHG